MPTKFTNFKNCLIMNAEDTRLSENDKNKMGSVELTCSIKGFKYINIRRIIATKGEIDEAVRTEVDHMYINIDFITKRGEEISTEMYDAGMKFAATHEPVEFDSNEAENAALKLIKESNDEVALDNIDRSDIIKDGSDTITDTITALTMLFSAYYCIC